MPPERMDKMESTALSYREKWIEAVREALAARRAIRRYLEAQYGGNFDTRCRMYEADADAAHLADALKIDWRSDGGD
jgi:hypothetical protein